MTCSSPRVASTRSIRAYSGVGRTGSSARSGGRREGPADVDQLDAPPELGLNSPVAPARPLLHGMSDHTPDGDHRRLAGRQDRWDEPLHERILVGEHPVEVALGGIGIAVTDVQRQPSGTTDRWLDDRIVPAVESHQLTKIDNAPLGTTTVGTIETPRCPSSTM